MKQSINVNGAPAAVRSICTCCKNRKHDLHLRSVRVKCPQTVHSGSVEAQTIQSLENVKTILEGTGSDFDHVVKTTIFLADIADFGKVNEIYAKYFANEVPARSCVEVANLPKAALVEIEAIAVEK